MRFAVMGTVLALFILAAVLLPAVFFPVVAPFINELRTDAASESLSCTTGTGETSCTIALTDAHMHYDTTEMTITETSPGSADRTSTTTVAAGDHQSIAITGLSASTAYTFNATYVKQASGITGELADMLKLYPLIFLWGPLLVGVGVAGWFLWKAPIPGLVRVALGGALVIFVFYFLPTINSWADTIAADANVSGISGYAAAVNLMPAITLGVVLILAGIFFFRRNSA